MTLSARVRALRDDATAWCAGRWWHWRALLLAYLAYAGTRHLTQQEYESVFSGITLAIHELGHVLFGFLGEWMGVAGGSVAQLAAPLTAAALFRRQRDHFGVAVAGAWLSFSLAGMSIYIADARAEELPLVSLGDGPVVHDWGYLLESVGMLAADTAIARLARAAALLALAASVAWGAWLCVVMARRAAPRESLEAQTPF